MLPADYLKRLRSLELRARLVSEQLMSGQSLSVFKGRGLDLPKSGNMSRAMTSGASTGTSPPDFAGPSSNATSRNGNSS